MFSLLLYLFFQNAHAEVRFSFDGYLYGQKSAIGDSLINPQNAIFQLDSERLAADLRGEAKLRFGADLLVLRPRLTANNRSIEVSGQSRQKTEYETDVTDAFHERSWSDTVTTTAGLQVFQWGPAEFLNPSNPFYHFNSQQRSLIHKEKGKVLLRLNYSSGKEHSLIIAVEPVSNNEAEWISEEVFNPKIAVKYEKVLNEVSDYAGVVAGVGEQNVAFVGEYFSWSVVEGFSVYADVKHSSRKKNFAPEFNGFSIDMVALDEAEWPLLSVGGIRWEGEVDVRLEMIYNSAGYNYNEFKSAVSSATNFLNPLYMQNLSRFQRAGLELPGKNYGYLSFRVPDPFETKDTNFYARFLRSQDGSFLTQLEADKLVSDSFTAFSSYNSTSGAANSEFRLANDWQMLLGIKWGL